MDINTRAFWHQVKAELDSPLYDDFINRDYLCNRSRTFCKAWHEHRFELRQLAHEFLMYHVGWSMFFQVHPSVCGAVLFVYFDNVTDAEREQFTRKEIRNNFVVWSLDRCQ